MRCFDNARDEDIRSRVSFRQRFRRGSSCGALFLICSHFARGQRYCSSECQKRARRTQWRAASRRHQRSPKGWASLVEAVYGAGFSVINAHPVKSEMSVATPKSQAKEPIQLDIVLVCRPREVDSCGFVDPTECVRIAVERAIEKLSRLRAIGLDLSLNDCRITVISQYLCAMGPMSSSEAAVRALVTQHSLLEEAASKAFEIIAGLKSSKERATSQEEQMTLRYEGRSLVISCDEEPTDGWQCEGSPAQRR